MELTVLGSGAAVPSLRRGAPGFLLAAGRSDLILLDSGAGTLRRLLAAGVRHDQITHALYSHNHLDHTGELASWLFLGRVPGHARTTPLTVAGSEGFMTMAAGLRAVFHPWLDDEGAVTWKTMAAGGRTLAGEGWEARAFTVDHIPSSLGFRVTEDSGRSLAYTGDTAFCEELVELARGVDLLLIEASAPDGEGVKGHMTPSEAGEVARRAGAGKVVLTHFYPRCDEVDMLAQLRRVWRGEALLAEDGLRIPV
ncbi:MAG TPA: MBL fold metallo-hydrolase [Candidatus Polarisedimenticolia bacterium]|nr:MBL fold metallo-hydrolase [Candidatus Polarisedimenticolia bacterium]